MKKRELEEGSIVAFSERTSAYINMPKHEAFHNVSKKSDVLIERKVTFTGKFKDFAGNYIVTDINYVANTTVYVCQREGDENIVIKYITENGKPIHHLPYKIIGKAKRYWERIETY